MRSTLSRSITFAAAMIVLAAPANAKVPSSQKLMDMAARCAYVVGVAEGNDVQLNYGSAEWYSVIRLIEQKAGLDGEPYLKKAAEKYNKRARVMGASEAYNYMLGLAQTCDREMGVLQS